MKKILKDKKGAFSVEQCIFFVLLMLVLIFSIQTINLITTGFLVKQRTTHSVSVLEADITEDIYESLSETNLDYYKSIVIDEENNVLTDEYEEEFFIDLKKNLNYDNSTGNYRGNYFEIKGDNVSLNAYPEGDDSIRIEVTMDVEYTATIPFLDHKFTLLTKEMKVSSNYSFLDHGFISENPNDIEGNEGGYGDSDMGGF